MRAFVTVRSARRPWRGISSQSCVPQAMVIGSDAGASSGYIHWRLWSRALSKPGALARWRTSLTTASGGRRHGLPKICATSIVRPTPRRQHRYHAGDQARRVAGQGEGAGRERALALRAPEPDGRDRGD